MALARSLMDRIEEDAARTWQRLGEEPAVLPFKNINPVSLRQCVLVLKERLARKGA